jgi:hypothetical protein
MVVVSGNGLTSLRSLVGLGGSTATAEYVKFRTIYSVDSWFTLPQRRGLYEGSNAEHH